jgi:hypothetical protein
MQVGRPPLYDQDIIYHTGKTQWEEYYERRKKELFKIWNEDFTVEIYCPVCDSQTSDGSLIMAQVLLEQEPVEKNHLVPEGFNCFVCGLHISPEEHFLANHFVGELPEDVKANYLNDIPR